MSAIQSPVKKEQWRPCERSALFPKRKCCVNIKSSDEETFHFPYLAVYFLRMSGAAAGGGGRWSSRVILKTKEIVTRSYEEKEFDRRGREGKGENSHASLMLDVLKVT